MNRRDTETKLALASRAISQAREHIAELSRAGVAGMHQADNLCYSAWELVDTALERLDRRPA